METDLVKRLRARFATNDPPRLDGLSKEAADEIERLEKAITIIGCGLSRTRWGPKLKDYAVVHREYMDYVLLKLVDIQALYKKYPDAWREVPSGN